MRNRSVLLNHCSLECPELIYDAGEHISHSTSCSASASFKSDGFFEVYTVLAESILTNTHTELPRSLCSLILSSHTVAATHSHLT